MAAVSKSLIGKLTALPPERVAEVETFVDFLSQREQEHRLAAACGVGSSPAFAEVWDNPEDAVYDAL